MDLWRLEKLNWTLVHTRNNGNYEIVLQDMTAAGPMLDWIFQVSAKTWATREDIGDLIEALDTIFHPQATLCSGKSINSSEFLGKRYA